MSITAIDSSLGKLTLRLTLGGLMIFHGVSKIMYPASLDFISGLLDMNGLPTFLVYGVYIGEVIAPIMIIIGFKSRLGALFIIINMLFALVLAHSAELFKLTEHGGSAIEIQLFYLLTAVVVLLLGSGKFAVKPD